MKTIDGANINTVGVFTFYAVLGDNKSLKDFLDMKRVQYIPTDQIKKFDPEASSFINLNTPQDVGRYLDHKDILRFKRKQRGG